MSVLRFMMLLSLAVWVGALILFPVVAEISFSVLPSRHLAGLVVGHSLRALHWMAIVSGIIFLASSLIQNRLWRGAFRVFATQHLLVIAMLGLTLVSQFVVIPRMDAIRASSGEISMIPPGDPARLQFDSLHTWSTRIEGGVLLLGLVTLYLIAAESNSRFSKKTSVAVSS
ncbi:MAG: hypothetical protein QOD84_514 [Acidobacteriaceae bacterium]|jgi:hypothetical protein